MAYTTAGGTKKKVCYYYDGMGHPECLNGEPKFGESGRLTLTLTLVLLVDVCWLTQAS